jgi:hypothetical protein
MPLFWLFEAHPHRPKPSSGTFPCHDQIRTNIRLNPIAKFWLDVSTQIESQSGRPFPEASPLRQLTVDVNDLVTQASALSSLSGKWRMNLSNPFTL